MQLESLEVDKKYFSRFEEHLKDIWQRNGDSCSVIYAGTGALEGKSKVRGVSLGVFYLNCGIFLTVVI